MRGEQQVPWASRTDSPQRRSSQQTPRDSPTAAAQEGKGEETTFFSPSERRFDESPFPMSPETQSKVGAAVSSQQTSKQEEFKSAPPEMLQPHQRLSELTEGPQTAQRLSFDMHALRPVAPAIVGSHRQLSQPEGIQLDRSAPYRAMRDASLRTAAQQLEESALQPVAEEPGGDRKGKAVELPSASGGANPISGRDHAEPTPATERATDEGPTWGESFRVEWVRTVRLPFTRTRHIRNPWNHDREVKVSRDGTELEPSVGQALLEEWDKPEQTQPAASGTGNVEVGRRLQGRGSISADALSTPASGRKGEGE